MYQGRTSILFWYYIVHNLYPACLGIDIDAQWTTRQNSLLHMYIHLLITFFHDWLSVFICRMSVVRPTVPLDIDMIRLLRFLPETLRALVQAVM